MRIVLLVANGEIVDDSWHRNFLEALRATGELSLTAVDGGLRHCERLGWKPDLLIGDLDSASGSGEGRAARVLHDPDQDSFDLEKALNHHLTKGFDRMFLLGAGGGRFDHHLANLFLLSRHPALDIRMVDASSECFVLGETSTSKHVFHSPLGTAASLLPLGSCRTGSCRGFRYDPSNLDFRVDGRLGSSNETSETAARIDIERGLLAVILHRPVPVPVPSV